jgi:hypothetical protein
MSKAYKDNQVKKLQGFINPTYYDESTYRAANRIYEAGGRIIPMWVRVFHATEYSWWWVHIPMVIGLFYYAVIAKGEFQSNPFSLIIPIILLTILIAPFIASYNELKKEQ